MLKNCHAASRFHLAFITLFCATLVLITPIQSGAASWNWQSNGANERIVIDLDEAQGPLQAQRNGLHSIVLPLKSSESLNLSGNSPTAGKLAAGANIANDGITLQLQNSAFGYLVSQPSDKQIVINIFPDPLGARWQPDGNLAPVGTAAKVIDPTALQINNAGSQTPPASNAQNQLDSTPSVATQPVESSPSQQSASNTIAPVESAVMPPETPIVTLNDNTSVQASAEPVQNMPVQNAQEPNVPVFTMPTMPPEDNSTQNSDALSSVNEAELPLQEANGALRNEDENSAQIADTAQSEPQIQTVNTENITPILVAEATPQELPTSNESSSNLNAQPNNTEVTLTQDDSAKPLDDLTQTSDNAVKQALEDIAEPNETLPQVAEANVQASNEENNSNEQESSARGRAVGAQQVIGNINTLGPEYWPEGEGINTFLPGQSSGVAQPAMQASSTSTTPITSSAESGAVQGVNPTDATGTDSPSATTAQTTPVTSSGPSPDPTGQSSATAATDTTGEAGGNIADASTATDSVDVRQGINTEGKPEEPVVEEEPRPVIYHDSEGNVVEKPPVPEELFAQARDLMYSSKYTEAVPILEQLRAIPNIPLEMREQVLYDLSEALFIMHEGKPLEGFEPITSVTSEAMNVNLRSSRVPDALYRLGVVNLGVGNFAEADGYFRALKRRYPYDANIPIAFYQLGKAQFDKGLYADAEQNFRMVVQEYPDASALDEATTSLVKSLAKLKNYKEAKVFADFAEMRWARYYVEDPDYINYLAEIEYNLGDKDGAMKRYWLLYNLDPTNARSSDVLAKIGDLYFETNRPKAAMEIFGEIEARFPKSDAAALAYLRRSEQGIYDSPINMAQMFSVFENPGSPLPQVVYKTLEKNRPNDKRTVTAQLKYALWQLWNREYTDAMGSAADFIDLHPENVDAELAKDVIMRGFMADLKNSLAEENYGRVLILWNGFPIVRERYGPIDPELRNALGRGYIERGEDEKAMEMLAEFLKTPMNPRYSEATFALYFNKYLENGNWNGMLDLGELVKDWNMPAVMRGQLDYALALSAENLGLRERALVLWEDLAENENIQLYQRAYATYFLAKDAEERQDIKDAYAYNVKTLEYFETLQQERSDRADTERMKEAIGSLMDITEVSNRIPEALEWVERYSAYVPENSPEYPGLRFREARLYRKLGNDERARLLLEIIVNDYASSPFAAAATTELSTFEMSRDLRNFMPGGSGQQGS